MLEFVGWQRVRSDLANEQPKFAMQMRKRTAFHAEGTAGAKAARQQVTYVCTMTRRCRQPGGVSGDGFGVAAWGQIFDSPGDQCQGIWQEVGSP